MWCGVTMPRLKPELLTAAQVERIRALHHKRTLRAYWKIGCILRPRGCGKPEYRRHVTANRARQIKRIMGDSMAWEIGRLAQLGTDDDIRHAADRRMGLRHALIVLRLDSQADRLNDDDARHWLIERRLELVRTFRRERGAIATLQQAVANALAGVVRQMPALARRGSVGRGAKLARRLLDDLKRRIRRDVRMAGRPSRKAVKAVIEAADRLRRRVMGWYDAAVKELGAAPQKPSRA